MKNFFSRKNTSLLLFLTFVVILTIRTFILSSDTIKLDGEHNHIALSLVGGNGYGNPFKFPTGPTAWTLPLPVFFSAAFVYFAGNGVLGFFLISLAKFVIISFVFYCFLKLINPSDDRLNNLLFYFIFFFYVYLSFTSLVCSTDDTWISASLMVFLVILVYNHYKTNNLSTIVGLTLLALLIPFGQPALILPLVLLLMVSFVNLVLVRYFFRKSFPFIQNHNIKIRHYFIWGFAFLLSTGIWTYRNYKEFNALVFSKSNLWFEFYMCNVIDKDGISSSSSWRKVHPYENTILCHDIRNQGEKKWLEKYKFLGQQYIKEHRKEYYRKSLNRVKNGLIFLDYRTDFLESPALNNLNRSDKEVLINKGLIMQSCWLCLEMDETGFINSINSLNITEKQKVINAWKTGKGTYQKNTFAITYLVGGIALTIIPFIGLIILFFVGHQRTVVSLIAVVYFLYLTVYFMVSHEVRYQIPLFFFHAAIVLLNFDYLRMNLRERINPMLFKRESKSVPASL